MPADDCRHRRGRLLPLPRFGVFALFLLSLALVLALAACALPIQITTSSGNSGPGISEDVKVVQGQDGATLVLASVTIHGKGPYTFALDTGASTSLISRDLAERLDLSQAGGTEPISGIGGVTQAVPVQIDNWHTGPINLPSMTIASAAFPHERSSADFQGLLGSDIWSRFGKFTLDYDAGTLTVYRQIALAPEGFLALLDRRQAR